MEESDDIRLSMVLMKACIADKRKVRHCCTAGTAALQFSAACTSREAAYVWAEPATTACYHSVALPRWPAMPSPPKSSCLPGH